MGGGAANPVQQFLKFNPYAINGHQLPIATPRHEGVNCQTVPQIPGSNFQQPTYRTRGIRKHSTGRQHGKTEKHAYTSKENIFRSRKRVQAWKNVVWQQNGYPRASGVVWVWWLRPRFDPAWIFSIRNLFSIHLDIFFDILAMLKPCCWPKVQTRPTPQHVQTRGKRKGVISQCEKIFILQRGI